MKNESRVKRTLLNAKINLICYFVSFITAFFTRKVLLDNLGAEFIGYTGTVGSLLSFLNLAELGIGTAISYVLYKPIAESNKFKINEIILVLGYLYQKIGYAILGMGVTLSLFLPLIFPSTTFSWSVIYTGFYAYLASSLLGYFVNYKATLLSADQRNYIVTGYFQLTMTSKAILQMVLAIYFKSFILYFAIELLLSIVNSIILNSKINTTYPWLKSEVKLGRQLFKKYPEIGKYTKQVFAHKVGEVIQRQLTPFLIYSFVSLPVVALYTNYTILTQKIEGLIGATISSTGAAVGNLIAKGNKERILKVFKELLAFRIFVTSIVLICILKFATPFITVWLGAEYALPSHTVALIAGISGLAISRGIVGQFIHSFGLFADVWAPYAESIIMVIFAIIGGSLWGLPGVLLGPFTSILVIAYIWKPYYLFSRGFKISVIKFWQQFTTHIAATAISVIATDFVYKALAEKYITLDNWGGLIASGAIYLAIITFFSTICYYITSKGFRDFVHRIKVFKKSM